jgi:hypothetical protein
MSSLPPPPPPGPEPVRRPDDGPRPVANGVNLVAALVVVVFVFLLLAGLAYLAFIFIAMSSFGSNK